MVEAGFESGDLLDSEPWREPDSELFGRNRRPDSPANDHSSIKRTLDIPL